MVDQAIRRFALLCRRAATLLTVIVIAEMIAIACDQNGSEMMLADRELGAISFTSGATSRQRQ